MQFLRILLIALELHLARTKYFYIPLVVALILLIALGWAVFLRAPQGFPPNVILEVAPGTSVAKEARILAEQHLIDSPFIFKELVRFTPGTHGVQAGLYEFTHPVGVITVAWNLSHGISGIPTARVTFPEGTTARQMGTLLAAKLPGFNEQVFDSLAIPHEGYLFPDTYFFLPGTSEAQVLARLEANYHTHIARYANRIAASGHSEREIITMASILEGEGKTMDDKRIIAGILWHRISLGMPLQVDAPFGYVYGLSGYTPTAADLASNSGYNTYRYKGLPQTPINNPGDVAIDAALSPTTTDYLYYLTGTDGQMYYAKTLAGHVENQKRYIKK